MHRNKYFWMSFKILVKIVRQTSACCVKKPVICGHKNKSKPDTFFSLLSGVTEVRAKRNSMLSVCWVPKFSLQGWGISTLVIKVDGEIMNSAYWPMFQMFALFQAYFALFAFSGRTSKFHLWGFEQRWDWSEPTTLEFKYVNHINHNPLLSSHCYK